MKPTPPPYEIRGTRDGYAVDAPNGDKDLGYASWDNLATFYGSDEDPEAGDLKALANATMFVQSAKNAERVKELEIELRKSKKYVRQQMQAHSGLMRTNKDLMEENAGLYMLIVRIREAAGDPEGRLMQDELVEHIAAMAKSEQRLNNGG